MNRRTAIATITASMLAFHAHALGRPFRVGVLSMSFENMDVKDARAVIDVWLGKISRDIGLDYTSVLFSANEELVAAVKAKEVDAVYLTTFEYFELGKALSLVPMLVACAGEVPEETFVVLAKRDGFANLSALKDRRLCVHTIARGRVPAQWLESELTATGLSAIQTHFSKTEELQKPRAGILKVFFGESDACLVSQTSFDMAAELNPQIGRKLAVVLKSKPMLPGLFCRRSDYADTNDRIVKEAVNLHQTTSGRQVLALMQVRRMERFNPSLLANTQALFELRKTQIAAGS